MSDDPAYPIALLRIALAMKLHPDVSLDETIDKTARAMRLSRRELRNYLATHMEMIGRKSRAVVREKSTVGVVSAKRVARGSRGSRPRSPR